MWIADSNQVGKVSRFSVMDKVLIGKSGSVIFVPMDGIRMSKLVLMIVNLLGG